MPTYKKNTWTVLCGYIKRILPNNPPTQAMNDSSLSEFQKSYVSFPEIEETQIMKEVLQKKKV